MVFGSSLISLDLDWKLNVKQRQDTLESDTSMESKASFSKGLMIWMLVHRSKYFWMRAIFQIIAFSFLIVTLLMLINFQEEYWHRTLAMLAAKHCIDFVGYTLDLVAFSKRKISLIKYKLFLDVFSICLIIAVQWKLFSDNTKDYVDSSLVVNSAADSFT